MKHHDAIHLANTRKLRAEMTDAEQKLWAQLRASRLGGFKFRRQMPLGKYIVDFACPKARLVVELDGSQHAEDEAVLYDTRRSEFFQAEGWLVRRFWNDEVLSSLDDVCRVVFDLCRKRANS
jgi:very-short-patch-repair endonuclease